MPKLRQIVLLLSILLSSTAAASAQQSVNDSLQQVLARTSDPRDRVGLLLSLKDLNENTRFNLPYSIQLFREAAAIRDTYAMSAAITPIINSYSGYVEKEDSLDYYIRELWTQAPGTSEEGVDQYAEMAIAYRRLRENRDAQECVRLARETLKWCDSLARSAENIFQRTKRLVIQGYANTLIDFYQHKVTLAYPSQIECWKEAYALTERMPQPHVRRYFASVTYYLLSIAYNQAYKYPELVSLTGKYIGVLGRYDAFARQIGRRPYFYTDNNYVMPYQQLMRGAINIDRKDYVQQHFAEFRRRMLAATERNLPLNKCHLYETGYLWTGIQGDYTQSLRYSDSLISMIKSRQDRFSIQPDMLFRAHYDRSLILQRAGRYAESADSYMNTTRIQDSLFAVERAERTETIRRSHEMDRRKLSETQAVIRSRVAVNISVVVIGLLVIGTGVYLHRAWRRNRALQTDILRHSLKAQESERMKSSFVDTICRGIGPPFNALDSAAHKMMVAGVNAPEQFELLETIRKNTELLLSTLDNMLEAANLDSLTDRLKFETADIGELCQAELLLTQRLRLNGEIAYSIDAPGTRCLVRTHAKYFSFVVRALLDNAGKYTQRGSITLRYELIPAQNQLRVSVTDTGCGVPPEKRHEVFRPLGEHSSASRGLSLALCNLIAEHLSGSIRLDESYTSGARFIFTIPAKP